MAENNLPISDISHLIPQKSPFVMVDALLEYETDKVVSSFKITDTNLFVKDAIFLESGLIENMAQTVALHTGYDYFLRGEDAPTGYIGSIKKVDVFELPKINDTIKTEAIILTEFMGVTMVEVKAYNSKNKEIASAHMKTVIAN